ncbi:MAG TPA: hypothetical protein VE093_32115 [Polyangiaceae bacterium]|nr:hypothetical protein [Polyangiaceae bacterium]
MSSSKTKKTAGFVSTFILSALAFAFAGVMMMGEASAEAPMCSNLNGFKCAMGAIPPCRSFDCDSPGAKCGVNAVHDACIFYGTFCLMSNPCNVICVC